MSYRQRNIRISDAVKNNDLATVQWLREKQPWDTSSLAIFYAIKNKNKEILEFLIESGLSVEVYFQVGDMLTPIQWCSRIGFVEGLRLLYHVKIDGVHQDPFHPANSYPSPIYLAVKYKQHEAVKFLHQTQMQVFDAESAEMAGMVGNLDTIKYILNNTSRIGHRISLVLGAIKGINLKVINYLIEVDEIPNISRARLSDYYREASRSIQDKGNRPREVRKLEKIITLLDDLNNRRFPPLVSVANGVTTINNSQFATISGASVPEPRYFYNQTYTQPIAAQVEYRTVITANTVEEATTIAESIPGELNGETL